MTRDFSGTIEREKAEVGLVVEGLSRKYGARGQAERLVSKKAAKQQEVFGP